MSTRVTAEALPASPCAASRLRPYAWWRRLAALGESTPASVGVAIVLAWVALALLAPLIAPYPPNANDMAALAHTTPSRAHWLGTDQLGRDLFSRVLWGARPVLIIAPLAVLGAGALGSLLGLVGGYYGRWTDLVITRACDIVLSFPVIILYMIILAHFGSSAWNIVGVLTLTKAPIIARIVRGMTLDLRARAARRRHVPAHRLQRHHHWLPWLPRHRPAATRSRLGRHGQGHVRDDDGVAAHGALPVRGHLVAGRRLQPAR